jgi:hypothetical protein
LARGKWGLDGNATLILNLDLDLDLMGWDGTLNGHKHPEFQIDDAMVKRYKRLNNTIKRLKVSKSAQEESLLAQGGVVSG